MFTGHNYISLRLHAPPPSQNLVGRDLPPRLTSMGSLTRKAVLPREICGTLRMRLCERPSALFRVSVVRNYPKSGKYGTTIYSHRSAHHYRWLRCPLAERHCIYTSPLLYVCPTSSAETVIIAQFNLNLPTIQNDQVK